MEYKPTIGLEIHAELKTRSKMFCGCLNDPEEKHPNQNVCPVCLGHPGTLPTINKKAVEIVLRVGLALGGKVNPASRFDRKNYFYPDLPKGYQISQYDRPLVLGGELNEIRIRRIHLEEDTGTLIHEKKDGKQPLSLVDFNRAGVPLMELVTEPDISTAEEAVNFAKEFQLILRYLDASDADMEKGQMRLEANVSLSQMKDGKWSMGAKVELKNINSFKALDSAIDSEIERQNGILDRGEKVVQETRGWDETRQKTFSQRTKEEAHDYRYFPEPDLPPLEPTKVFNIEDLRRHLPELPVQKRERFQKEFGLTEKQVITLIESKDLADFFEEAISELAAREETAPAERRSEILLFNYLTSDLLGLLNESGVGLKESGVSPEKFAHLIDFLVSGRILSRQTKDILRRMFESGADPEEIIQSEKLETISDERMLQSAIQEVLAENPKAVADFRKGKKESLQFLIGKTMSKLNGRGDPTVIRNLFELEK